tara:strand:+ start:710 stop:940 length:231 start_codon:yes stop_codon:yes gene_type:complete
MNVLKCKECGHIDSIQSIELITERFPVHVNGDEIEVDSSNGKYIYSEIECFMCWVCESTFGSDKESIEEMIVEIEG